MFHGSMVAMVTPMTDDGNVDFEALANLVEFHIDNNTDAIIAVGTTGESATLDPDEHCQVIRRIVEVVNKRIPVIAGTGANSTNEALHLSQAAKDVGADACLLVTPYYNKPTQEGLYQHFKMLAERIALPQILYNVPGRTSCDMLPDTVDRLANISNIVGIKESSTLNRIGELVDRCSDRMAIYSGDDPVAIDTILLGGKGVISVTANVAPHAMHAMCTAALQGDKTEAKRIDNTLKPLHKALFLESNPIPVKWAVQQLDLIGPGIRLPLTPLAAQYHEQVRTAMQQAGVL
ncbi:MAG: 4-hydroxy-tetrahydrodipicolinate synthase [Gammaproteobacteria bacterium]